MSTALPKDKVEQTIDRLRPELRRIARRWFHRTLNGDPFYRHGSDAFARKHPEFAVTPEQRAFMYELQQEGCSYREIEEILHLYPNSGNDAYRCVNQHNELIAAGVAPQSIRIKRKPRLTAAQLKKMVSTFVPRTPKEQAEYREIVAIVNSNGKRKKQQHQEQHPANA